VDLSNKIVVGKVAGAYGVKGWLKVFPFTELKENILGFTHWEVEKHRGGNAVKVGPGKVHGKFVIVQLEGVDSREQAEAMKGALVKVDKEALKVLRKDEYYWADLIGLTVQNLSDVQFGKVESLMETGANDVLVVKGERECLVPFILEQVVKSVDLDNKLIVVDWDPEF
jgi:16S rRNA processing protein RimM